MTKKKQAKPALYIHQAAATPIHRNISTTNDGRRRLNNSNQIEVPFTSAPEPELYTPLQEPVENAPYSFDDDYIPTNNENLDDVSGLKINVTERAKRYQNLVRVFIYFLSRCVRKCSPTTPSQDVPLKSWIPLRDAYVDDLIWLEGRGQADDALCADCQGPSPTVRCDDCHGGELVCRSCALERHRRHPLHRTKVSKYIHIYFIEPSIDIFVKEWNGAFFERLHLRDLGLRIQLNHPPGEICQWRVAGHKHFVVLHTNGIHFVHVDFCGCSPTIPHRSQLLRASWWPAMPLEPQTCATLGLLNQFHLLSLQGKTSAFDFYRSLEYVFENGPGKLPVS